MLLEDKATSGDRWLPFFILLLSLLILFYLEENSWRARPLKGYVFGTLRKHMHDESWELWVLPDTLEPVEALL